MIENPESEAQKVLSLVGLSVLSSIVRDDREGLDFLQYVRELSKTADREQMSDAQLHHLVRDALRMQEVKHAQENVCRCGDPDCPVEPSRGDP